MNDEAQQEFERAFSGEMSDSDKTASTDSGYGITPDPLQDPRDADHKQMADAFNAASEPTGTSVGAPESGGGAVPSAPATPVALAGAEQVVKQPIEKPPVAATPEFKSFGQAFKYHRAQAVNGGPKVFEWNGKRFTTQLKSEVGSRRSPATAAPPASPSRAAQPKIQAAAASTPTATPPQAMPASAPSASAFQPRSAAVSQQVKPLHVRQQEAYDEWQRQLSASKTWWGGQDILGPGQKERLAEAERRFDKLLSETK